MVTDGYTGGAPEKGTAEQHVICKSNSAPELQHIPQVNGISITSGYSGVVATPFLVKSSVWTLGARYVSKRDLVQFALMFACKLKCSGCKAVL